MAVTSTGNAASPTAVSGLASGIDSAAIIDALVKADRASTAVLEARQATFQTRLDTVRNLNTRLLSHQLDLAALNRPVLFAGRSAASSNTAVLAATATTAAATGTYQFEVVSVARASQVATAAQPSASSQIGAGTIDLRLGSGGTTTLNIDASSSSLTSIAQAINAKGLGINASVVNDANGARLLLASKSTGTANAITVSGTGALNGLFSGVTTVQAADDARLRIGSGAGAITLTQSDNVFKEVVQGVSLTAAATGTSTITIGTNAAGVTDAVKAFVASYNDLVKFMADNASFNSVSKKSGVLFSEGGIRSGFNSITQSLLQSVPGRPTSAATLSSIGITVNRSTGNLSLDESVLSGKLATDPDGVGKIFTNSGASSNPGVQYALMGDKTDTRNPFTINITTAADQARVAGAADLDASTVIDSSNRDLLVTVNGRDYQITLTDGAYTGQQLTDHVQASLNQVITTSADKVQASFDGARLSFTGATYGLTASIQVSGTANGALRLATGKSFGKDVEGTINGVAATGAGQTLSGAAGTAAEGLRLSVSATAPVSGVSLTVSKGLAQSASERVKSMTDSSVGMLLQKQDSLQKSIDLIAKSVTAADARLAARRARYQAQFLAMEKSINASNSLSSYFAGQVKGFENAASASSK